MKRFLLSVVLGFTSFTTAHAQTIRTAEQFQAIGQPTAYTRDDGSTALAMQFTGGSTQAEGLHVFDWDGLPLWSAETSSGNAYGFTPFTIGEIDGTPGDEIILKDATGLHVFDDGGERIRHLSFVDLTSSNLGPIVAHDFDGDGLDEIVLGFPYQDQQTKVAVLDQSLEYLPGWPRILDYESFGVGVYNISVGNFDGDDVYEIAVASAPGVADSRSVVVFDLAGVQVSSFDVGAVDMLAYPMAGGADGLLMVSDAYETDEHHAVDVLSSQEARTDCFRVLLGDRVFEEWVDDRGHLRRRYTWAGLSSTGYHADVLAVSGESAVFSSRVIMFDYDQAPFQSPVIRVESVIVKSWKVVLSTNEQAQTGEKGYFDFPVMSDYAAIRKGAKYPVVIEQSDIYTMKIMHGGQTRLVETSADRQGGWHRVVAHDGPVVLFNSTGQAATFVPMVGGELWKLPAPNVGTGSSWLEWRGGNRRKGRILSPNQ